MTKGQEVSTFSGDEVERPQFLWERRDGRPEQPTQQEEEGRGHGRHCNTPTESVEILKTKKKKGVSDCQNQRTGHT